jgi:hypothetical protein
MYEPSLRPYRLSQEQTEAAEALKVAQDLYCTRTWPSGREMCSGSSALKAPHAHAELQHARGNSMKIMPQKLLLEVRIIALHMSLTPEGTQGSANSDQSRSGLI